ncbi:hypothetical protein KCH_72160 [Kitasatospora cheerisanensis KCTC 2395]|uniref:Uncharacterized protein n=1 Tax=Kitasatospora cheerisanensis KCTC 2395 TaxID=1348663 RepID=A0A066YIZ9_9ACTN|nr:hypothetical protein KCH_72160 [Kitasatospora cheerisanensis KCTC 2395]
MRRDVGRRPPAVGPGTASRTPCGAAPGSSACRSELARRIRVFEADRRPGVEEMAALPGAYGLRRHEAVAAREGRTGRCAAPVRTPGAGAR